MKDLKEFIQKLSNNHGVSGYEENISTLVRDTFNEHCDETYVDSLYNTICIKKGENNSKNIKIMLAAHMDEIGLMIKDIDEDGFLYFTTIGGFDPRVLLYQEVIIHGKDKVFGVIVPAKSIKAYEDTSKALGIDDLKIDIGFNEKDAKELVQIGDVVTVKRELIELKNNNISGKALDDRACIGVMYECAKELNKFRHQSDVYFVGTVQEEVGTRGATTSTFAINPDIGIAIDVSFGYTPELPKERTLELGKGPGITIGGNIHTKLRAKLIEVCKEYNVPFQYEIDPGPTGTDARAIQITRCGIPTLLISIPLKYMHTSTEVVNLTDVKTSGKLLATFISSITSDNLEGLLCY
ncbi:lysyl aminopeptidase [Gottschalkia acidurici 9a]|uniref:Lysyl aminopeptidase n=1 Tax=Gottschalkia acidurici (strain ATCC 7906 / DSM 604 / BCRC 14475 / CIP 104303 / KCTC 5404 / NCIMB 10678 / 9a) TaxID=1128398 RepID=K0AXB8_GOTA9|nr:M42 family metallopeptidase [Gottschalkia acidurici]AFS78448.1 lysyl aminopeptidase [Gottschalkia acidurici 9a]